MTSVETFKFILLLLVAVLGLELIARRLKLPSSAALLLGGIAIAFLPDIPSFHIDPELVLIIFLPPLLIDGAYFTVWSDFKRNIGGILWLALGAVIFTTFTVGMVVHWIIPTLPWAACFALGAVVSPPDAVAAKAVLGKVKLPRRLMALLEGESLLNDATGLVLFRFAVVAALTGTFSLQEAGVSFLGLALGGLLVGGSIGFLVVRIFRHIKQPTLVIMASVLCPWAAYIGGESLHVSGVISTVACGIIFGWYQHDILSAEVRVQGGAFWRVMISTFEALVFILIGLSLRDVISDLDNHSMSTLLDTMLYPIVGVIITVILSRFIWVYATDYLRVGIRRLSGKPARPPSPASSFLLSWAGMRGVVTIAIALTLPENMPGRDLILLSAFAVILFTVLIQGSTIGLVIQLLKLKDDPHPRGLLTAAQTMYRVESAQLAVVEALAYDDAGVLIHTRLLEQYTYRTRITERYSQAPETFSDQQAAHYDVILAAVAAGRAELLKLHRSGQIHDEVLHALESDLDLQEITAMKNRE
ncbi:Na+/H+ antiporter [Aquirhabdus sp.]|uniref:Na+/H+ antiporter n=1 Tax=Aquirhabdus sp. TaxID=2824160 RepID=UPI00396CD22A